MVGDYIGFFILLAAGLFYRGGAMALRASQHALIGAPENENYIKHDLTDLVYAVSPYARGYVAPAHTWRFMEQRKPHQLGAEWDFMLYDDLVGEANEGGGGTSGKEARKGWRYEKRILLSVSFTYSSNSFHVHQTERTLTKVLGAATDGFLTKVLGATYAMQVRTLVRNRETNEIANVLIDGAISSAIYTLAAKMLYFSDKAEMAVDGDLCKLCSGKEADRNNLKLGKASDRLGACDAGDTIQYGIQTRKGEIRISKPCDPLLDVPPAGTEAAAAVAEAFFAPQWFFLRKGNGAIKVAKGRVEASPASLTASPLLRHGYTKICNDTHRRENVGLHNKFCMAGVSNTGHDSPTAAVEARGSAIFAKRHASLTFKALVNVVADGVNEGKPGVVGDGKVAAVGAKPATPKTTTKGTTPKKVKNGL